MIYQFYNKEFVELLVGLLNELSVGRVVEVMAGNGKLTKFLEPMLLHEIVATDDKSWVGKEGRIGIKYPEWVIKMDAFESVEKFSPDAVVMCWEPYGSNAGNEIAKLGVPMVWIGEAQGGYCGNDNLFLDNNFREIVGEDYCLARTDYGFGETEQGRSN